MADLQSNENQLGFVVNVELDKFKRQLSEYDNRIVRMESNTNKATGSMEGMFKKLAQVAGVTMSGAVITSFLKQLINVRGEFQKIEIAFETILGSQEKANALMAQLTETAAKTPFEMQDVTQGAKQLLAYGTSAEEVNDTLIRLGNIASGLSIPLGDLVQLYGTTMTQGRIFTQDLRQFMGRGIPLAKELAKQFGVTEAEVQQLVTNGKVGFEEVRKALENLTDEGGMFYQLMEKQSASLAGQYSNLQDAITQMVNEIGQASQEMLSSGLSVASWAVENYKTLGKSIATCIEVYGSYKTALIVSTAWEKRAAIARLSHIKLIKMQAAAQTALNAVTKLNPYVAIAAAVVGMVAIMATWRNRTDEQKAAQERLNKSMDEANNKIQEESVMTLKHIGTIQDKTKALWEQIDAYNELQKYNNIASGKSIDEIRAMSSSEIETQNYQDKKQKSIEAAQKALDDANANLEKVTTNVEKAWKLYKEGNIADAYLKYFAEIEAAQKNLNDVKEQFAKKEEQMRFDALSAEDKLLELEKKRQGIEEEITKETEKYKKLLEDTGGGESSLFDRIFIETSRKRLKALSDEADGVERQAEAIRSTESKLTKDYEYWQNKKKEATDEFHKNLPGTKEFNAAKKNMEDAQREMDKWDGKIKETKAAIEDLIKKWNEIAEKSSTEASMLDLSEFDRRKKENKLEYKEKIKELDDQLQKDLKDNNLSEKQIEQIQDSYDEAVKGVKKEFQHKNDEIQNDTEYYLYQLYNDLAEYSKSELDKELDQIENDAESRLKELATKFGIGSKEYVSAKKEIDWQKDAKTEDATVQSLITKEQRLTDIRVKQIELTKTLRGEANAELDIMFEKEQSLQRQIKLLEDQKHGLTDAEEMQLESLRLQLQALQNDRAKFEADLMNFKGLISDMYQSIGSSLSGSSNDNMAAVGKLVSYLGSSMQSSQSISQKYQSGDKAGAYAEGISAAVSGTVELFNLVYDQVQSNKASLEAWDLAVQNSAQKLKLLELEAMEWQDSNIWGTANPISKLQSYLDKNNKAAQMAYETARELASNEVKTGTKKVYDVKNTMKGMGIGTSIGAAIGTMIYPGLGTAIGAGAGNTIGTLIGLFGGKKIVDVYENIGHRYGEIYDPETLEMNKQILADYEKMDDAAKQLIDTTKELLEARKDAIEEYKTYMAEITGDVSGALSSSLVTAFTNNELYTAVDSFRDYVKQQIESIIQSKVFAQVFQGTIDELNTILTEGIIDENGVINANIEDKLAYYPQKISTLLGQYDTLMTAYQEAFAKGGYDLFASQAETVQDALSGTIASMSEDTATKLNGNFMGLKLSAMEISANVGTIKGFVSEANEIMGRSMGALNRIADNTAYCEHLRRLDELADDISEIKRTGVIVR